MIHSLDITWKHVAWPAPPDYTRGKYVQYWEYESKKDVVDPPVVGGDIIHVARRQLHGITDNGVHVAPVGYMVYFGRPS